MWRLLADENLNNHIIRGLRRRLPTLDLVRVQDVGLLTADDETILGWAASADRLILTHDVETMIGFAYARLEAGLPMPGLMVIAFPAPVAQVIADLELMIELSAAEECAGQVIYLPLR